SWSRLFLSPCHLVTLSSEIVVPWSRLFLSPCHLVTLSPCHLRLRRSMTQSPAKPKPVQVGRYRYSKLRWRLLVRALDLLGTIALAIVGRFRPVRRLTCPRRVLVVQLDHLGDAVLSTPLIAELRAAYREATIDVL